jgi:hypothetical protein
MNVESTDTTAYVVDTGQALLRKRGARRGAGYLSRSSARLPCPRTTFLQYHGKGLAETAVSANERRTQEATVITGKKRKRIAARGAHDDCPRSTRCDRPSGHVGRCSSRRLVTHDDTCDVTEQNPCARSARCDRSAGHVGRCSKRLRCSRSTLCDRVPRHVGRCNRHLVSSS